MAPFDPVCAVSKMIDRDLLYRKWAVVMQENPERRRNDAHWNAN
jgi:hypothetical protein